MPASSIAAGRLTLRGPEALRALERGLKAEDQIVALDNSGWEMLVQIERCSAEECAGRVLQRRLAAEKRTKISLYHPPLPAADYRRLITSGTALGVVAFVPLVADRCEVQRLEDAESMDIAGRWQGLAREAAEAHGRGRCPVLAPPMLYDQALDRAQTSSLALLLGPGGERLSQAVSRKPWSVDLLCPPAGGFSPAELKRARERGVVPVAWLAGGLDPVAGALGAVRTILSITES